MAFKLNSVVNHIVPDVKDSIVIRTIGEYATLKSKIDKVEEQSWYFKKAIDKHLESLKNLRDKFETIKNDFDQCSVDGIIEIMHEKEEDYKFCVQRSMPIFVKIIGGQSVKNQIAYHNELLTLKSKIKNMESIDYYVDNPDEFMKLM